jgi:hypothetical protein
MAHIAAKEPLSQLVPLLPPSLSVNRRTPLRAANPDSLPRYTLPLSRRDPSFGAQRGCRIRFIRADWRPAGICRVLFHSLCLDMEFLDGFHSPVVA